MGQYASRDDLECMGYINCSAILQNPSSEQQRSHGFQFQVFSFHRRSRVHAPTSFVLLVGHVIQNSETNKYVGYIYHLWSNIFMYLQRELYTMHMNMLVDYMIVVNND